MQIAMQRAVASSPAQPNATRARASLDEDGWTQLRRSCPARPGDRAIDVKVAKRLLSDPVLYRQAVHAIGTSPSVAAVPAAAPSTVEPP